MEGIGHLAVTRWLLAMANYTRKRIGEIAAVFIKHGFKNKLGNPRELRLALEELGPSFIKIGQLLSTRPDLLPMEYIVELQNLQDNVKPEKFHLMKEVIEGELGDRIDNIFSYFDETPIASASLSEVFYARLKTGEKVAVKVQRPYAREKMLSDIRILKKLVPLANLTSTKEIIDIRKAVDELSQAMEKEFNFIEEAKNIKKFREKNKNISYLTCINVYEKYCTEKILVMDYISGIKVSDTDRLKEKGYDLKDIAVKITYNYFKQVFEDGFFHADPHPGNILVHNNTIGYIDFGLMGNLDADLVKNLNKMLEGVVTKDINLMMNSLLSIGIKKGNIDKNKLYKDIGRFYNAYAHESIHNLDIQNIMDEIMEIAKSNNIAMPHNIILFAKGVVTLQGILAKLDDTISIMDIALPYFKDKMIKDKFKKLDFSLIAAYLYSSLKSTVEIPSKLVDFLTSGIDGRLRFYLDLDDIERALNTINKMINRLIISIIIAALLVSSSLVINANVGLKIHGISAIGIVGYLGAAIGGLVLLVSIFRSGKL